MKKNMIVALIFVLVLCGALLARENMILKVKVQTANVRSEPDASASIVARVASGVLLEVDGQAGVWYEVTVNDQSGKEVTGYIHSSVVEVVGGEEEEPAPRREMPRARSTSTSSGTQMNFGINFGIMTDDDFKFKPLMWTAGAELDFQFGDYLMLSPEVMLVGNKFEFKEFILYPAAILNFTAGGFFIGGGVTKAFYIGSGHPDPSDFLLKLNAGFLGKSMKLTAYAITPFDNLFKKGMAVGATLGFRF